MSAQIREEINSLIKPWLAPLRLFATTIMLVSLVSAPGIFIYVAKQPSEPMERVAILSDAVITANRSKLETHPISWVAIAAVFAGIGASLAREWTKREDLRIRALLEQRYGYFPPPPAGLLDRIRGRG